MELLQHVQSAEWISLSALSFDARSRTLTCLQTLVGHQTVRMQRLTGSLLLTSLFCLPFRCYSTVYRTAFPTFTNFVRLADPENYTSAMDFTDV